MSKTPSPKQIAARERFAAMARAGKFKRKAGAARRKRNPSHPVPDTILAQLGGNKFVAMTGAKHLLGDPESLSFTLPARMAREGINKVRIALLPDDTYRMQFMRYNLRAKDPLRMVKQLDRVYADQLRPHFTEVTGLETSLGTMERSYSSTTPEDVKRSWPEWATRGLPKGREVDISEGYYLAVRVPGHRELQWLTGLQAGTRAPVLGPWSRAIPSSAEQAAINKATLEREGYSVEVVPVERIEANPHKRVKARSKAQDLAIAMSEQRAGHPRKAREFFKRAARAKNPASDYPYRVEMEGPGHSGLFVTKARFKTAADAKQYARALGKAHRSRTIRVMSDVRPAAKWLRK